MDGGIQPRSRDEMEGYRPARRPDSSETFFRARGGESSLGARPPREEAWLLWKKTLEWLRPGTSPLVRGRTVFALTTVYYSALFVAAGVALAGARRRGIAVFCAFALAITMAVHVLLLVLLRYRMASWDPILILYAPSGILRLLGGSRY